MPPDRKFYVLENRILDADAIADADYRPADEKREFSELRIAFKAGYQEIGMTLCGELADEARRNLKDAVALPPYGPLLRTSAQKA